MTPFRSAAGPKGLSTRQTTPRHLWLAGLGLAVRGVAGCRMAGARLQVGPARVRDALEQARRAWAARSGASRPQSR